MKKSIAQLTALALCLTLLAACGGKTGGSGTGQPDQPSQSEPAETGTPETPSETPEEPSETPAESSQPVVVESPFTSDAPAEPEPSEIVEEAPALTLSMKDATITYAGYVLKLKATVTGIDGHPDITWTSDDESVATVDEKGNVTSVGPGKTVITAKTDGGMTASCIVRCRWKEDAAPAESESQTPAAGVDLSVFASDLFGRYEFGGSPALADSTLLDSFYSGLTGISTRQCIVYVPQMSMNMGELALIEVSDAADVAAVTAILQARIDYMAGDGNGPGGAWYPEAMDTWESQSRVVSSGNYVMMVVNGSCDSIVSDFKALF